MVEQDGVCSICGGKGFYLLDVPPSDSRYGKAIICECRREALRTAAIARLRGLSGIDDREFMDWTFEKYDLSKIRPAGNHKKEAAQTYMGKVLDLLKQFAQKPQGWIVLQGDVGTGKSHLAFAVALERIRHNRPVYIAAVPEMLDMLRAAFNDENEREFQRRFDELKTTQLLILDDLGSERGTEWANERLFLICNYRYQKRLPMLITTNDQMRQGSNIDRRIISRMSEGSLREKGFCKILRLPLADYRPYHQVEFET